MARTHPIQFGFYPMDILTVAFVCWQSIVLLLVIFGIDEYYYAVNGVYFVRLSEKSVSNSLTKFTYC